MSADGYDSSSFLEDARSVFYLIKELEKLRRRRFPRRAPARGGNSAGSGGSVILDSSGRPATPSSSRGGGSGRRPALSVGNPLQIAGGKSRGFTARAGGRIAAAGRGLPVSLAAGMAGQGGRSGQLVAGGGRIARQLAGTFGRANLLGAGIAAVGGVLGGAVGSFLGETALESAADAVAGFLSFGSGEGAGRSAAPTPIGGFARAEAPPARPDAAGMLAAAPAGFGGEARRPAAFDAPTRGGGDERGGTIVHA